jgi:predicted RNA-binding Zn ribbon-like protein
LHFAHAAEDSLDFIVALANTAAGASRSGADELSSVDQLTRLLERYTFVGRVDRDEAELAQVRAARAVLRDVWTADRDDAAAMVNEMLRQAPARPYLVRHDGSDWHVHATEPGAPLAERMRVDAALALMSVIRTDETGRLRVCAAGDCFGLFADTSRNGSRRFCSVRCGNRVNTSVCRARRLRE